jgi:hypothetical protein
VTTTAGVFAGRSRAPLITTHLAIQPQRKFAQEMLTFRVLRQRWIAASFAKCRLSGAQQRST